MAVLLLSGLPSTLIAGPIDPRLHFRQVRTPHFTIYFHQEEERLASHLVAIVEDVRARVGASLGTTLPAQTHVIIADQAEFANGYATPLPRNIIFLNATAPSGAELIGHADDWLRVLFTHEYTHIVHLDRSRGWATLARGLFGRAPFAFPNLTLPQWQIEGLATWQESTSTGSGRATAGDFRAVETIAAGARRPLTLDRASGGLVSWPDGHAAYAAGLGFHEYLAGRFGDASIGRLADATAGRLPYLGTPAFKRIYGESLGSLWSAYSAEVARRAESLNRSDARPVAQFRSGVVSGPRFAPASCDSCPHPIVYSVEHADGFPSLREVGEDGRGDRELTTRYLGSTAGITPTMVVFDQLDLHRVVGLYADLFALDRRSGHMTRLTIEGRMQDPDITPDGHHIVVTKQRGDRRELLILDLGTREGTGEVPRVENVAAFLGDPLTSFSAPRWSPDGRLIAVERRRAGALPEGVIVDVASRQIVHVLASPGTRIVTPTWRPDGGAIVAAADFGGQPFDLYEFALDSSRMVRRLTKTAGALWPDVRRDGRAITYAGSTAAGSAVFVTPYAPLEIEAPDRVQMLPRDVELPAATSLTAMAKVSDRPYSPVPTLLPTSWSPVFYDDADGTRVGGAAYGADVLGRHAYGVEATWFVERPAVARTAPATADWSVGGVHALAADLLRVCVEEHVGGSRRVRRPFRNHRRDGGTSGASRRVAAGSPRVAPHSVARVHAAHTTAVPVHRGRPQRAARLCPPRVRARQCEAVRLFDQPGTRRGRRHDARNRVTRRRLTGECHDVND
ncbi:MAG: hypothetical protein U0Q11_19385 [Vicinamibacterales bacterium]